MTSDERACKRAWKEFNRIRNFSKEIPNCVWDIEIELPAKPKRFNEIINYGLPKKQRKFPLHDRKYIEHIDNLPLGNTEREDFIDQEFFRRKNGIWFYNGDKLEWIDGHYYMTLQYWLIPTSDSLRSTNPKFVDMHRDLNLAIWWTKKNPKFSGTAFIGCRRSSKTTQGLASGYWDTTEKYNAVFGIHSKTGVDAQKLIRKIISSWQKLPEFLKPLDTGYTSATRRIVFSAPQKKNTKKRQKTEEALDSYIEAFPSKEEAMDGLKTTFQFIDEYGKCFTKDVEIRMFDGSLKKSQDIAVGDLLMGIDGEPRKVSKLFNGFDRCYWVKPKGKAYEWGCNINHTLSLKVTSTHVFTKKGWVKGQVIDIPVYEYLSLTENQKRHLKLYSNKIIYPEKETIIDPYLLGLWIGDGITNLETFRICSEDFEVRDFIEKYCSDNGYKFNHQFKENCNGDFAITSILKFSEKKKEIRKLIKENDNKKVIPKDYLINSEEKRLELLAGLIDSDGYLSKRNGEPACFEVVQKYESISNSIYHLARGLGFNATITKKKTSCINGDYNFQGEAWRVIIYGDLSKIPTKIKRKKAIYTKYKPDTTNRNSNRKGFHLEPMGVQEYFGFQIEGKDHYLYLKDGTIAHNCTDYDVSELQEITKICCFAGVSKIVGYSFWATTVEDMEKKGGKNAMKVWDKSDVTKLTQNGRTESTMNRLFFPSNYGMFDSEEGSNFIDEWGYSNMQECAEWLDREESNKTGEDLIAWRRKFPRTINDCFKLRESSNSFSKKHLIEQKVHNDKVPNPVRGNFVWDNPTTKSSVTFFPDENGRWLKAWEPPVEERNKYKEVSGHRSPLGHFCKTGCDPFGQSVVKEKGSDGTITTVLDRHYSTDVNNAVVCIYRHRPPTVHEFYDDVKKQCMFYSSELLAENNKSGLIEDFRETGWELFTMHDPLETDRRKLNRGLRGISMSGERKRRDIIDITQAYIYNFLGAPSYGFCPFNELIREWMDFEPDNWTPYDLFVSTGLALAALKKSKTKQVESFNPFDLYKKHGSQRTTKRY